MEFTGLAQARSTTHSITKVHEAVARWREQRVIVSDLCIVQFDGFVKVELIRAVVEQW